MGLLQWKRRTGGPKPCAAVIVASGTASRMGGIDKVMADLGGKPVLQWTIEAFQRSAAICEIVVVTRQDLIPAVTELCRTAELSKVTKVVPGGESRSESVLRGLEQLSGAAPLTAIQDGARPLVEEAVIAGTVAKASATGAAAPAVPVKDTIKLVKNGVVEKTLDRSSLYAVQTPQVFDADFIKAALYQAVRDGVALTDDCSAAEALGLKVHLVPGSERNLKITTPQDLAVARLLAEEERQ